MAALIGLGFQFLGAEDTFKLIGEAFEAIIDIIKLVPSLFNIFVESLNFIFDIFEWMVDDLLHILLDFIDKLIEGVIYIVELLLEYDYVIFNILYTVPLYLLLYYSTTFINAIVD
jgi:phage-related protein